MEVNRATFYKSCFCKHPMRDMNRREFITHSFGLLLGAQLLQNFKLSRSVSARIMRNVRASSEPLTSTLHIAQNGSPQELLTAALNEFGGIGKVVKKGQRVVIKVNISFNRTPEQATTTNPELVDTLVRLCREAGAREVLVLDHTIDNGKMCLDSSEMEETVKRAGGTMKAINSERDYTEVDIPRGNVLKRVMISKDVLDADVFINVPIAKVHNSAVTTLSMKNLMGIVWDRGEFHWRGLHECIADLSTYVKPDLIVLDAYRILMTGGPGGPGEVKDAGEVVIGTDCVAVDTYGTVLLERNPDYVGYINAAVRHGLGEKDLDKVNKVYVDAQKVKEEAAETTEESEETEETEEEQPAEEETPEPVVEQTETPEPIMEEPQSEEEKEAGIPAIILIPALVVSFLIGLRMRRMKKRDSE